MGLPRRAFLISGAVFAFIGAVLLISSYQGITGNAILGDVDYGFGSVIGIWFAVTGIVLLMGGRTAVSKLESDAGVSLEVTRPFEKSIKGHDSRMIGAALAKIGTGSGDEHVLRGGNLKGYRAISAGKGGRIIFDYKDPKHASLVGYLSGHDYRKAG